MTPEIRPYTASDREALLSIGAETAFFGAPIEAYMEDRQIFKDAFYAYYTDYEPEHAWLAVDEHQVVGFITGCIDSRVREAVMRNNILPHVFWNWLRGKYHPGRKTYRYAVDVFVSGLRREFPPANLDRYPAHLHINLLPGWRGLGLGRRLINQYITFLTENHIPGVHLHTTSMNVTACKLYESVGFQLTGAVQTGMYNHLVPHPVENRCYAMRLNEKIFT